MPPLIYAYQLASPSSRCRSRGLSAPGLAPPAGLPTRAYGLSCRLA